MNHHLSSADVLGDIFKTLQRLETRLEGQNNRLGAIELSIRSGDSTSPSTRASFSISSIRAAGLHKELPCLPACPPSPSPSSPERVSSPADAYKASMAELRRRFEFVDDSCSDFNANPTEAHALAHENRLEQIGTVLDHPALVPRGKQEEDGDQYDDYEDDLVYTESAYSRPLSRFDLSTMAEPPPLPRDLRIQAYLAQSDMPPSTRYESVAAALAPSTTLPQSRGTDSRTSQDSETDSSIRSISSSKSGRHETAEIIYFACENFKTSLQTSKSLRSAERKAAKDERRRLKELAKPIVVDETMSPGGGKKGRLATLGSLFFRFVDTMGFRWSGKVDIIA